MNGSLLQPKLLWLAGSSGKANFCDVLIIGILGSKNLNMIGANKALKPNLPILIRHWNKNVKKYFSESCTTSFADSRTLKPCNFSI